MQRAVVVGPARRRQPDEPVEDPTRHRFALSRLVCERLHWRRANGLLSIGRSGSSTNSVSPSQWLRRLRSTLAHASGSFGCCCASSRSRRSCIACTAARSAASATAPPRWRRCGGLSTAGASGSLLAAATTRPPFPQPLAQFLELRTRRLQFVFQPLLSLYRLAVHSAVIARLPAHFYYLAPQLGYLAPARRRAAIRTPPESSHPSSLSTPIGLCPADPHHR